MDSQALRHTLAWVFLVLATWSSLWASLHAGSRLFAIAVIMALAAVKVVVVLRRFMRADRLPLPLRLYFYLWSFGCAAMITVVAGLAARDIG